MKLRDIVNRDIVNLDNCDQEPIHVPGSIQPHGFLLGLNKDTFEIVFASNNTAELIGIEPKDLLGKSFSAVFGEEGLASIKECMTGLGEGRSASCVIQANGDAIHFLGHESG